mgnify:CR=1 FL=1
MTIIYQLSNRKIAAKIPWKKASKNNLATHIGSIFSVCEQRDYLNSGSYWVSFFWLNFLCAQKECSSDYESPGHWKLFSGAEKNRLSYFGGSNRIWLKVFP